MSPPVQKFIVSLTYPLTLSLWLLACAAVLLLLRRRKLGGLLLVLSLAWSLLWSIPLASDGLRGLLERRYPVVAEAALPKADAIVVLGGGSRYAWLNRPDVRPEQLQSSRLAAGARAWLSGRAPIVILSGGGEDGDSEAQRMAAAIARLGVPASALILEDRSRNTHDNALFTAALADRRGMHRVLLVTSSLHMPRASLLFRNAGVDVVPVPVPERAKRATWRQRWVPSFGALWRSGRALKEYAGLLAVHLQS
jgi:uncharacterized SAM-binding protein YcdF (DUF218 family)